MSDIQKTTYGARVLDADALEAQAVAQRHGGNIYGSRVIDATASDDEPTGDETVKALTGRQIHAILAEHPEQVHALTGAELAREEPRKTVLRSLRAIAESRQTEDADAAATVADIDAAITALDAVE